MNQYTFKIADNDSDFEQIFELNYQTFVEEIPQHEKNESGKLVDKFHDENTYLICLKNGILHGMMALRDVRPFSLDAKVPDLDQYLPEGRKTVEIRLLSVIPEARTGRVLRGLLELLVEHNQSQDWGLAIISATTRQLKLYKHLGFTSFGPLVGSAEAQYQPMYVEFETFQSSTEKILPTSPVIHNFLPGPVAISTDVEKAFASPPISHRSSEFKLAQKSCEEKLCKLTSAKNAVVAVGSGSLANDMVAAQLSRLGERGMILANGEFGERLIRHAERFNLPFDVIKNSWGNSFDLSEIEGALNSTHHWLWMVACETSTGMKNDIEAIGELCQHSGIKQCIDAVSAVGAYHLDLKNVYLTSGSSGKALASFPGLALVLHNHEIEPDPKIPASLDIGYYYEKGKVPFTHSSNLIEALNTALDFFETPEARYRKLERISARLRSLLEEKQIPILVEKSKSSPAVFTIPVADAQTLSGRLKKQGILVASESDYLIDRNWIQVCLMGNVTEEDISKLVAHF